MSVDSGDIVKIGVVRKRKRINVGNLFEGTKQVALVQRNGLIYIEPADHIIKVTSLSRLHLGRASKILDLNEGDKFMIVKNVDGYVLLKVNVNLGGENEKL